MINITDIPVEGYEEVRRAADPDSGLLAYIAVHSTVLGPALGGARLWPYESEEAALKDALRLAKGMTSKAACAGLDLGGGKAVILADPSRKSEKLFEALGEFIESFDGRYITAEDVNTKPADMSVIARKTRHVSGLTGRSGNPSPYTAHGCFLGLKAVLEEVFGSVGMIGKIFAIEGCGSVGSHYGRLIAEAGGTIVCADLREGAASALADETGGTVVSTAEISQVDCDVYCPCALGGSLNDKTIPHLKARAVAGCANNQLADTDRHGRMLWERGILYAPDYVISAGGLINIFNEIGRAYDEARSLKMMEKINSNLKEIFRISREEELPTSLAADRFAERRLGSAERAGAGA